jgi:hypothetical protein
MLPEDWCWFHDGHDGQDSFRFELPTGGFLTSFGMTIKVDQALRHQGTRAKMGGLIFPDS